MIPAPARQPIPSIGAFRNRRLMLPLLGVAVALSLLSRSRPAHAAGDGPGFDPTGGMLGWLYVLELVIPDVRFEVPFGDNADPQFVLSWPLVLHIHSFELGDRGFLRIHLFAEPQYATGTDAFRGLLGARTLVGARAKGDSFTGRALAIEVGGVAGQDGHGAMFGVGPMVYYGGGIQFGLMLRTTRTGDGWRGDAAFDLQIPL